LLPAVDSTTQVLPVYQAKRSMRKCCRFMAMGSMLTGFVTEVLSCTCPRTTSKHRHNSFDWYTLHEFWATTFNKLKII